MFYDYKDKALEYYQKISDPNATASANDILPAPLSVDDETKIINQLKQGDKEALDMLIQHNLQLAVHIAQKYINTGIDIEVLISVGITGLIKGITAYCDYASIIFDLSFEIYVSCRINDEILIYIRALRKAQENA